MKGKSQVFSALNILKVFDFVSWSFLLEVLSFGLWYVMVQSDFEFAITIFLLYLAEWGT
jgi:hypothetical protein